MNLAELLIADCTDVFLADLANRFRAAYATASIAVDHQLCQDWVGDDETQNMTPLTRRAHVETQLRNAAISNNYEVVCVKNNWWRHNAVSVGRFRLIQCSIPHINTKLRHAEYKEQYAHEQLLLPGFEMLSSTLEFSEPHILAVILHRAPLAANEPEFMTIRFPLPDLTNYHPELIDLAGYGNSGCGESTSTLDAVPIEHVPELAVPKFKAKQAAN